MPRMKLSTRTLSIILAAIIALAIFVAISAVGNSIKQTEREVRAKHETAEKIRAARGY
jgi:ABC-type antimicrobial peptide transport system permease subunit